MNERGKNGRKRVKKKRREREREKKKKRKKACSRVREREKWRARNRTKIRQRGPEASWNACTYSRTDAPRTGVRIYVSRGLGVI